MQKGQAEKHIILFGCGELGYQVLNLLGAGNVQCFCDNNTNLQGTEKWGKKVCSLKQVKEKYINYTVLICAKLEKAYKIASQLDDEGVSDYWIYPVIERKMEELSAVRIREMLCDKEEMFYARMINYRNRVSGLEQQLDYMKHHADIRTMKPATGVLRERQMALAELGAFISGALEKFQVKPFLCGGNLLGYFRNGGFIPWDDDMDFELIREEYDWLCKYCLSSQDENGVVSFQYKGKTEKLKFVQSPNLVKLVKEFPDKKNEWLDFFSIDYYADDYSFTAYREDAKRIRFDGANKISGNKEKIEYIREEMEKNPFVVKRSNTVFFGFDNQESVRLFDRGKMMPKEVIFPLQPAIYEGKKFWVPNRPEEFLEYNFYDIWSFPDDVGIQKHNIRLIAY